MFDDSTGGSNWCLKVCRACGALFEWRHEYTFLVGGSEDTTTLDWLDDHDRPRAMQEFFRRAQKRSAPPDGVPPMPPLAENAPVLEVPIQEGNPVPAYPMIELLRARAPIDADELAARLAAHARFVERGGAGGGWGLGRTCASHDDAVILTFYRSPAGVDADDQARLALQWIVPPIGRPLELPSADLLAVRCRETSLDGANLAGAILIRADLAGSSLRDANLSRADCTGAVLRGCDLRGADLRGTDFEGADLSGADVRGARLAGTRFVDARTVGIRT